MTDKTYVASCGPGGMELTTWMRRCFNALTDKGIPYDVCQTVYSTSTGRRIAVMSIEALDKLVRKHDIKIDRSGYLNVFGLVSDE